jgi:hypothetical protein
MLWHDKLDSLSLGRHFQTRLLIAVRNNKLINLGRHLKLGNCDFHEERKIFVMNET